MAQKELIINLQASGVKAFFSRASSIKTNTILTALGYIKIIISGTEAQLVKHNLGAFIIHSVSLKEAPEDSITILADEAIFKEVAGLCNSEYLTIKVKGNRLKIGTVEVDGGYLADFPKHINVAESDGEVIDLPDTFLNCINSASNYVEVKMENVFRYVHVEEKSVFGSDSRVMYFWKNDEILMPPMTLGKESCVALSSLTKVGYINEASYDIFISGDSIYGFSKAVAKAPPHQHVTGKMKHVGGFEISRADLVGYLETCMVAAPKAIAHPIKIKKKSDTEIILGFEDFDFNVTNFQTFTVSEFKEIDEALAFNASDWLRVLKPISSDLVTMQTVNTGVSTPLLIWVKEDPHFIAMLGCYNNHKAVKQ